MTNLPLLIEIKIRNKAFKIAEQAEGRYFSVEAAKKALKEAREMYRRAEL